MSESNRQGKDVVIVDSNNIIASSIARGPGDGKHNLVFKSNNDLEVADVIFFSLYLYDDTCFH